MDYRTDILDGRFEFKKTGFFYELYPLAWVYLTVSFVVCFALWLFLSVYVLKISTAESGYFFVLLCEIIMSAGIVILFMFLRNIIAKGRKWQYDANGRYMRIFSDKKQYNYSYTSVKLVEFQPLKFCLKQIGFKVTVYTNSSIDTFNYIEPRKCMMFSPTDTPFDILRNPPAPFDKNSDNTIT